jgi:hypothetical protein
VSVPGWKTTLGFTFNLRPLSEELSMTTTMAMNSSNGQVRKTLASQLDRLDQILDTLGEGLNEAVGQAVQEAVEAAVREGVRQGVRGALSEVLTNPEVLAALRAALAPEPPNPQPAPAPCMPPSTPRKSGLLGRAWGRAGAGFQKVGTALGAGVQRVRQAAGTVRGGLQILKPFRTQLLVALGVGTAVGVAVFFAGPYVAAASGWLAGVLGTVAVQAGVALRRTLMSTELTS